MTNRTAYSFWKKTAIVITALLGALLFLPLAGPMNLTVQELSLRLWAVPSLESKTVLEIPPFGNLSAQTHWIPAELHVRLERIGADLVKEKLTTGSDRARLLDNLKAAIPKHLKPFILRQLAAGALGAGIFVLVLWRPRPGTVLKSALGGAVLVGCFIILGAVTYRADAFREPEYDGVIALAPEVVRFAEESLPKLQELEDNTKTVVSNMKSLMDSTGSVSILASPENGQSTKTLLLVSDLHSNPLGVEFMRSLVSDFAVDLIIDAGDFTDFGSPLETGIINEIENIGAPYLFSPGNHDTTEISTALTMAKNAAVLGGEVLTASELEIAGFPDPLSGTREVTIKNRTLWKDVVTSETEKIQSILDTEKKPDILVIHNPEISRKLAGYASLIISGHTHKQKIEVLGENTILINPGSIGAAGLRGLYSEKGTPYSAVILHFSPEKGATAADLIQYDPLSKRFSLERQLLDTATLSDSP